MTDLLWVYQMALDLRFHRVTIGGLGWGLVDLVWSQFGLTRKEALPNPPGEGLLLAPPARGQCAWPATATIPSSGDPRVRRGLCRSTAER